MSAPPPTRLTPYNRTACSVSKLIGVVATNEMQLLRWNNPGARHHTSLFYGERGWMSRTKSAPPAEGEKCS